MYVYILVKKETDGGSKKLEMLAKVGLVPARSQIYTHNYFILCDGIDSLGLNVGKMSVLGL